VIRQAEVQPARGASFRGFSLGDLALDDQLARRRNELAAIFDGIDQRIEAPDQEMGDEVEALALGRLA
jgi:hypothetical protein